MCGHRPAVKQKGGSCTWVDRPAEIAKFRRTRACPHVQPPSRAGHTLFTVTACQSCVVDVQRRAETRALPQGPQRKKGGRSIFGKWTTGKAYFRIFEQCAPRRRQRYPALMPAPPWEPRFAAATCPAITGIAGATQWYCHRETSPTLNDQRPPLLPTLDTHSSLRLCPLVRSSPRSSAFSPSAAPLLLDSSAMAVPMSTGELEKSTETLRW